MQANGFRYAVVMFGEGNWTPLTLVRSDPEELVALYASHAKLRLLPDDQKGIVRFRADAVILNTFSVTEAFNRHDGLPQQVFDGLVGNGTIEQMDITVLAARHGVAVPASASSPA